MKILINAQLPPGLGLLLNQAGHDACHVFEIGLRDADDAQVWDYAVREGTTPPHGDPVTFGCRPE